MFIIKTNDDKMRAINYITSMSLSPVQFIDIDDYEKKRSSNQNRYFHKCVKIIADYTGYSAEEVKDKIVLSIWQPEERVVVVKKDGKSENHVLRNRRSTAKLNTKEFSLLVDAIMVVAHSLKLTMPSVHDYFGG